MKTLFVLWLGWWSVASAAPPVVSNIRASQRPGTKLVDVYYDLSDADGDLQLVQVAASSDAGLTYGIPCASLSGHVGASISPGSNRKITWNAGADWNGNWVPQCRMRVTAHDGTTPPAPPGMAYIPGGPFQMGDNLDGMTDAMPVHNVQVDAFFMDKTEVTKELWQSVQTWGNANGYSIDGGGFKDVAHPVHSMNWYDAVKWCNARSQKENLTPCYYTDAAQTLIYKSGNTNIDNTMVKWTASGYRLPTEAEWEKAARGGATGLRYPWGNSITVANANYSVAGNPWATGSTPYTSPVGSYPGNAYGLFDMAGNLWEWTWDWYASSYYGTPESLTDPHGPVSGSDRVSRGGRWGDVADGCRVAFRFPYGPGYTGYYIGFRTVRR
jgi:formylglycine-generating enzyme required for sulfatase activity